MTRGPLGPKYNQKGDLFMAENIISLQELHRIFCNLAPDEIILDVRSSQEWAFCHIPQSLNIPHEEVREESQIETLKKYNKIYIHCRMGGRASKAYETLKEKGFNNIFLLKEGGMQAWIDEGLPTEKKR
jgi:rhodanese-related sulfurtransferase